MQVVEYCIICQQAIVGEEYHYTRQGAAHDTCHREPKQHTKISSCDGWYRGQWVRDTCACGAGMLVPTGKVGRYRCNRCADIAEGAPS